MSRIILCRAMPLSTTELGLSRDMASYMSLSINQKAMVLSPTKACRPESLGSTDISVVHVLVHQPEGNGLVACKPEGLGFLNTRGGQRIEGR